MDIIKLTFLKELQIKTIIAEAICYVSFCLLMHFANWNPVGYGQPLSIMVFMTVTIFLVFYFECVTINRLKTVLKEFIPKYLFLISTFGLTVILSITFCKIRTIYFFPPDPLIGIWLVWVVSMIIFAFLCANYEKEKKQNHDLKVKINQTATSSEIIKNYVIPTVDDIMREELENIGFKINDNSEIEITKNEIWTRSKVNKFLGIVNGFSEDQIDVIIQENPDYFKYVPASRKSSKSRKSGRLFAKGIVQFAVEHQREDLIKPIVLKICG